MDEYKTPEKKAEKYALLRDIYEADRETDTTSNEAVYVPRVNSSNKDKVEDEGEDAPEEGKTVPKVKVNRQAISGNDIMRIAKNCSCCVFMLAFFLVFGICAFFQLPFIGHRIQNMSYTQIAILVIGLSIGLCNLMPNSRMDRFAGSQRKVKLS